MNIAEVLFAEHLRRLKRGKSLTQGSVHPAALLAFVRPAQVVQYVGALYPRLLGVAEQCVLCLHLGVACRWRGSLSTVYGFG